MKELVKLAHSFLKSIVKPQAKHKRTAKRTKIEKSTKNMKISRRQSIILSRNIADIVYFYIIITRYACGGRRNKRENRFARLYYVSCYEVINIWNVQCILDSVYNFNSDIFHIFCARGRNWNCIATHSSNMCLWVYEFFIQTAT